MFLKSGDKVLVKKDNDNIVRRIADIGQLYYRGPIVYAVHGKTGYFFDSDLQLIERN